MGQSGREIKGILYVLLHDRKVFVTSTANKSPHCLNNYNKFADWVLVSHIDLEAFVCGYILLMLCQKW